MGLMSFVRARMKRLSPERKLSLVKFQNLRFRRTQHLGYQTLFGSDLKRLALAYNTDKWGDHYYAQHYETHFGRIRHEPLNVLEIGVGGYDDPELGGGSLRMWRTYFPNARIYGIDIHDKSPHDEQRIKTFRGSQIDLEFLDRVVREIGRVDIVIDDGSHVNEHVITSFKFLFPRLATAGWYVIEDTETSYWPEFGGSSIDLRRTNTSMGFLRQLVDGMNYKEFTVDGYQPTYFDRNIVGMHFYHNVVFIEKAPNTEPGHWKPEPIAELEAVSS
jgi:demethylmacrocin O-methyltransferase